MANGFTIERDPKRPDSEVYLESRLQMDGSKKWVIKCQSCVINKDGEMEYEPLPSSRTDEFIENTRFDSKEEVYEAYIKMKDAE